VVPQAGGAADTVLGASAVLFNAPAQATVYLVLQGATKTALSEYQRLDRRLAPLLDGALPSQLNEDTDVVFLSGETGEQPDRIWFYALANRFEAALGNVPAMAFYGLMREGAGTTLPTLLENSAAAEQAMLTRAGDDFIIATARLGISVDDVVSRLQAQRQIRE
jgi:hypothetical protein